MSICDSVIRSIINSSASENGDDANMDSGFWKKLPRPFFALAPMADVTDAPFRRIIAAHGKPDVMFTEFVSADGLAVAPEKGRQKLLESLRYTEAERPMVAQFFTADTEHARYAVRLAVSLGFDGVDINMGCPDRAVEKQGAGAALMKNPTQARALIRAAKEEAVEAAEPMPISVKTRIGYAKNEIETWLPALLAEKPAAITIHARTRKEMSDVPAHWDIIKRAVEIRDEIFGGTKKAGRKNRRSGEDGTRTLIIGNGDIKDVADARARATETGADGIMLGRAIFGNPWLFAGMRSSSPAPEIGQKTDPKIRLAVLLEHTRLFEETFGNTGKSFAVMKKHFKAYVADWPGAADLRLKLMETKNADEVEAIIGLLGKRRTNTGQKN